MNYIMFDNHKFVKDRKNGYYHAHYGKVVKLLHRVVWESYYGSIKDGFHIHHKDGNKDNNDISNLELIDSFTHLSLHSKKRFNENKEMCLNHLSDIRESSKYWHSSEEGIKWHRQHAIDVMANMEYVICNCEQCGKEFSVKKAFVNKSRFCSNACKSKNRRDSGIDNIIYKCSVCGKEFIKNKYSKKKTCSRKCSKLL